MYLYGYANCNPRSARERKIGPLRVGPGASRPASRTSADPPLGTPTPPRHRSRAARSRTERHWESQGTPISGALHQNPHLEPRFPDARRGVGRICSIV